MSILTRLPRISRRDVLAVAGSLLALPTIVRVEGSAGAALVINLRTTRGLGLTVPPALLARADKVIE